VLAPHALSQGDLWRGSCIVTGFEAVRVRSQNGNATRSLRPSALPSTPHPSLFSGWPTSGSCPRSWR